MPATPSSPRVSFADLDDLERQARASCAAPLPKPPLPGRSNAHRRRAVRRGTALSARLAHQPFPAEEAPRGERGQDPYVASTSTTTRCRTPRPAQPTVRASLDPCASSTATNARQPSAQLRPRRPRSKIRFTSPPSSRRSAAPAFHRAQDRLHHAVQRARCSCAPPRRVTASACSPRSLALPPVHGAPLWTR